MSLVPVFGPDDPVVRNCLSFLRSAVRPDGSWPIDSNLSVWLTTSALGALTAGHPQKTPDDRPQASPREALAETVAWVAARQTQRVHPFTGAAPGGFPWSHLPGAVPDADDTSGALLALQDGAHREAVAAGVSWLLCLQNRDGGFPTFCRGWGKLPFDQSCPDITAHAIRAIRASCPEPDRRANAALDRAMAYLQRTQTPEGSWVPLWFGNQHAPGKLNPVLGTARVLMALCDTASGESGSPLEAAHAPMVARGVAHLLQAQNEDGGWGGAPGVASSVEETALAVAALSHRQTEADGALARGTAYLVGRVQDGTWTQTAPIGLYFSQLWYSEVLYPIIWTTEALARVCGSDG